jgi:hypothetical protein
MGVTKACLLAVDQAIDDALVDARQGAVHAIVKSVLSMLIGAGSLFEPPFQL